MTQAFQIIGMFSGLSGLATLLILIIRPIRERVLGTKDVREGQKWLLRADMLRTYYNRHDEDRIRQHEKENFLLEYRAYKALGGNSFMDDICDEVRRWEVET